MDAIFSRTKIRVWRLTGTDTWFPSSVLLLSHSDRLVLASAKYAGR